MQLSHRGGIPFCKHFLSDYSLYINILKQSVPHDSTAKTVTHHVVSVAERMYVTV